MGLYVAYSGGEWTLTFCSDGPLFSFSLFLPTIINQVRLLPSLYTYPRLNILCS